jgi:hypothetical protein
MQNNEILNIHFSLMLSAAKYQTTNPIQMYFCSYISIGVYKTYTKINIKINSMKFVAI